MNLKRGETCCFSSPATLYEERTARQYVSGSRGVSIRVAKGLSFRVGASRGYSVPVSHVVAVCDGTFSITNKRCVFTGPRKTVTVQIDDLISFDSFDDGIQLHHERSKGLQVFKFVDGEYAAAVLSGLMTPAIATDDIVPIPSVVQDAARPAPTPGIATDDIMPIAPHAAGAGQPVPRDGASPWHERQPVSAIMTVVTIAALVFVAPIGIALAWWLKRWSVPVRALASIASLAFFTYIVATMPDVSKEESPAVKPLASQPAQSTAASGTASETPREDEAAWIVQHCKPDEDTTKTEGGQPIRHLVYRKADVELMYARNPGETAWQLVGRFKARTDDHLSEEETARRLPCATGHLKRLIEQ